MLATIWGYNWVAIKIATHDADPFTVSALRVGGGALVLLATMAATRRSLRPTPAGPTLLLAFLQTTLFTLLSTLAVAAGGAGKAAVLTYTMPFWIVLLAWPVLHERVSRSGWWALGLAALGLALVAAPLDLAAGLAGKALAVASAIVWAASAVYGKFVRSRQEIDLLALTAWQMFYGAIPLVLLVPLVPHHLSPTPAFLAAIAYVVVPATALAWLLWMFILSRLPAGVAGVASLLTPVVGVVAAWLQLGERPGALELAGMACIVAALMINLAPGFLGARLAQRTLR